MQYTINTSDQLRPILKGFRKTQGLSQKAMADKLGISQQTYQVLEASPHKVTIDRFLRVLSILNVKLMLSDAAPVRVASSKKPLAVKGVTALKAKAPIKSTGIKKLNKDKW